MSRFEDRPKAIRDGEQLDLVRLRAFLEQALATSLDGLEVEQFRGGYSNLTYLVRSGGREWVLRRPPFGSKVERAHDMVREHTILSRLCRHKPWAPRPVALCTDPQVLEGDFYLMERLRGVILRAKLPDGLVVDPELAARLCDTLLDTLIELHALDYREVGLGDLGRPDGYVERQVSGWARRYDGSRTDDIPAMTRVAAWLHAHMPASPPPTVIHNDYKLDNVMYDSERFERVIGVFDWEMATVGDPLMDLGTALCYWVEAGDHEGLKNLAFGPTTLPGMATREGLCRRYAAATGRDLSHILFYYVFGLYKTAVVLQQIYYRFAQGLTQDPRFAGLIHGVGLLADKAEHHIATRTL